MTANEGMKILRGYGGSLFPEVTKIEIVPTFQGVYLRQYYGDDAHNDQVLRQGEVFTFTVSNGYYSVNEVSTDA